MEHLFCHYLSLLSGSAKQPYIYNDLYHNSSFGS